MSENWGKMFAINVQEVFHATKLMITSKKWKNICTLLSFIYIYLFVFSRFIFNDIVPMVAYSMVHLYQTTGLLICTLMASNQMYFSDVSIRPIETFFFPFIMTPYTSVRCILGTMGTIYHDPTDSPVNWLIYLTLASLAIIVGSPFLIDEQLDTIFFATYLVFVILAIYVWVEVINKINYRSSKMAYFNLFTWIAFPFMFLGIQIYSCWCRSKFQQWKIKTESTRNRHDSKTNQVQHNRPNENFVIGDEGKLSPFPSLIFNVELEDQDLQINKIQFTPSSDSKLKFLKNKGTFFA